MNNNKFKQTEIGEIPENWEVNTISNFTVEIIDGDRGLNYPKQGELLPDGYCLFLSTKNVPSDNFDFTEKFFVTEDKDKLLRKGKLQREDIVLTTRGTVGNIALFDKKVPYNNIRINSGMVILRNKGKDFDLGFLYQLLKSGVLKRQYASFSSGSAQPQLPIKDLKSILLVKPSIVEQKRIASFLLSLDDKIELNRKMNKTIEEIGKALFKRWFVDFEFPNDEGKPYKSSGGEMVDSELGEMPKGWEIKQLCDISENIRIKIKPRAVSSESKYIGLEHFTGGSLSLENYGFSTEVSSDKWSFSIGDILFGKLRPYFKNVAVAPFEGICSTDILVIKPKDEKYLGPMLFTLFDDKFISQISNASTGTKMPRTSWNQMSEYKIVLPNINSALLKFYSELSLNISRQIVLLAKLNTNLSRVRNILLPRLMSGKLRVKNYEN